MRMRRCCRQNYYCQSLLKWTALVSGYLLLVVLMGNNYSLPLLYQDINYLDCDSTPNKIFSRTRKPDSFDSFLPLPPQIYLVTSCKHDKLQA